MVPGKHEFNSIKIDVLIRPDILAVDLDATREYLPGRSLCLQLGAIFLQDDARLPLDWRLRNNDFTDFYFYQTLVVDVKHEQSLRTPKL